MSNSKIIQAVNAMIYNDEKISDVVAGEYSSEIFFLYKDKYKWSIIKPSNENQFFLHYYPGNESLEELAGWPDEAWNNFSNMVSYGTKEIATREAYDTFQELHSLLKGKIHGMGDVLEDIIDDAAF